MIRDLFQQIDLLVTYYNDILKCISCLDKEHWPENSGILKCLKAYYEKVLAVIKTRDELLKVLMKAMRDARLLHEAICSEEYGLVGTIEEWEDTFNCGEECGGGSSTPADPCKEQADENETAIKNCLLIPMLSFPLCNDPYYLWVKDKYDESVEDARKESEKVVAINKKKEGLAACKTSLDTAIIEVNPKELCK
jgi:hypothetical protein